MDQDAEPPGRSAEPHEAGLVRLLADKAQDVIYRYRLDPEPRFEYVSPAVEQLTGYSPEEFYADPELALELMHPDQGPPLEALLTTPSLARRPVVARIVHRDGSVRWTEQRNTPVTDEAGRIVAIEGIARDITAQKLALDELRHSQAALAEAQELARIGSWEWDIPNNRITWSDELYRLYGLRPQEFEATYEAYLERVHPGERELARSVAERAFQDHQPFEFDHRLITPDGSIRWLRGRGKVVVSPEGEPVRMVGTAQDITERKASEERFRSLLEAAPDAMVGVDSSGAVSIVNAEAERLFARERDELVGSPVETLVPSAHHDALARALDNVVVAAEDAAPPDPFELELVGASGTIIPVELTLRRLPRDPSAGAPTTIVAFRDITARREAERRRRETREREVQLERLRAQDEFRTRLVNTVAHELNTPLTPLAIQLHILRARSEYTEDEAFARAVDVLDRNAARLTALVKDLLEVARIQSGQLEVKAIRTDLVGIILESIEAFRAAAEPHGIELVADVPARIDVVADPHRMGQVVDNLISNAIKYSPDGGTVEVRARIDDGSARVTVSDTGIGLAPERVPELFQPFSQVHDPDQVSEPGSGLGLFICKGIVEQHGGRIEAVSSGPGRGSTFAFEIPAGEIET